MTKLKPKIKHSGYLIISGEKFDIIAALNINGKSPFFEYFSKLYEQYMKSLEKGKSSNNKASKN